MRQLIRKYWLEAVVFAIVVLEFSIRPRSLETSGSLIAILIAYMIHDHRKQGGQTPQ